MPADIVGTDVHRRRTERRPRAFEFQPGPDLPPTWCWPTRSTAPRRRRSRRCSRRCRSGRSRSAARPTRCRQPFFVLATQNPIEMEGTYPLPEAQLDRFLFKLLVGYPRRAGLRTPSSTARPATAVPTDRAGVGRRRGARAARAGARRCRSPAHVQDYAVRIVMATHPGSPDAAAAGQAVRAAGQLAARRAGADPGRQDRRAAATAASRSPPTTSASRCRRCATASCSTSRARPRA